ncbi:MAG: glycosyltransferase [Verrucomicrobiota bacterium]
MKISVLINNFNYGHFLDRAVQSVVAQTARVDEIIVVDDGSSDNSLEVLKSWADRDSRIQIIAKKNGGQLSCFNAGFERCSGDIICFLDADDEYYLGYITRLQEVYRCHSQVDLTFCRCELVDGENVRHPPWELNSTSDIDFGLTFCRTFFLREWLGGPTSAISMRRALLARILPCALENEWLIRADDVLLYGAAALLGRKFYLAEKCVRHHVHGQNQWYGSKENLVEKIKHDLAVVKLLHHINPGFPSVREYARGFSELFFQEFSTIPHPSLNDYKLYRRMICKYGRRRRLKFGLKLWKQWRKIRRKQHYVP